MTFIPIRITKERARRFLLQHQHLLPPRSLSGKAGIKRYIRKVGCIQFDPVNVVGRNPDLVLQARIQNHSPRLLDELIYKDHVLMDAWDKVSSICLTADWPYFERHRQRMRQQWWHNGAPETRLAQEMLATIRTKGKYDPSLSQSKETIIWNWGRPARLERAALEVLYAVGAVRISSREGNRRTFDIVERLVPNEILKAQDPNTTLEAYHDWHVLRRIGSLGLAQLSASEFWLGIQLMKTSERKSSLERLLGAGKIRTVEIAEIPGKTFFTRTSDLPALRSAVAAPKIQPQACFLPPLDNLLWDRKTLSWIFDFDYIWEQYTPPEKRKYSHYALPVLHGERFVARTDLQLDRKINTLKINHWWWEDGVKPGKEMRESINRAIEQFMFYLSADSIQMNRKI